MMNKDNANGLQIQKLLESDLLQAPEGFDQRVLREIEREIPSSAFEYPREIPDREIPDREIPDREIPDREILHREPFDKEVTHRILDWWQWLAVVVGSLVGMTQVSRFIFGLWLSAAVG